MHCIYCKHNALTRCVVTEFLLKSSAVPVTLGSMEISASSRCAQALVMCFTDTTLKACAASVDLEVLVERAVTTLWANAAVAMDTTTDQRKNVNLSMHLLPSTRPVVTPI